MMNKLLSGIPNAHILSDDISPLIHISLDLEKSNEELDAIINRIVDACLEDENPVAISKSLYIRSFDTYAPPPTIKVLVSAAHSEDQIRQAAATIKRSIERVVSTQ